MASSVYIETTVPSAFVSQRRDPASLFRQAITRDWWANQRDRFGCFTSDAVTLELQQGEWPGQADALALIESLPRVPVDDEVVAVALRYVAEHLVPASLGGDATHLAAACVHDFDFLLTWNIRHLANPNKLDHLTVVNRRLGLLTPQIVTPETLWIAEES